MSPSHVNVANWPSTNRVDEISGAVAFAVWKIICDIDILWQTIKCIGEYLVLFFNILTSGWHATLLD